MYAIVGARGICHLLKTLVNYTCRPLPNNVCLIARTFMVNGGLILVFDNSGVPGSFVPMVLNLGTPKFTTLDTRVITTTP